jgi:hypothetical protein
VCISGGREESRRRKRRRSGMRLRSFERDHERVFVLVFEVIGPSIGGGRRFRVPRSKEVVALEKEVSFEETETPAEDEEELEVEKSMRGA